MNLAISAGKLTASKIFQASDLDQNKVLDVVEFNDLVTSCF
jgi:hypothetical protein